MKSYRCPASVCNFVNKEIGIDIKHNEENAVSSIIKFVDEEKEIDLIIANDSIKKLFYQESYKYNCNGQNWGESKGGEFADVCVILNPTTLTQYKKKQLSSLKSKNKFYVACTRTKGNLYFIPQNLIQRYKNSN